MDNPASGKTIDGVSRLMEKPLVVDPTAGETADGITSDGKSTAI